MKQHCFFLRFFLFFLAIALSVPIPSVHAQEADSSIGGKNSGIINIVLVGQDSRDESRARSDTIILCTVQPSSKQIIITSFLRDLYLPIPGLECNRINAAYACGGLPLLKETLRQNFGILTDGCVEVDFSSFPQIIDLLGGVSMELREDEARAINATVPGTLTEGTHLLNGNQALAYSRIRYLDDDGDFSRTLRQRKLLTSLLDSYRNADLLTILSVVVDALPMISTDLSKKQILSLAAKLFPLLDDPSVSNQKIPAAGTYTNQRINGMDVLVANLEENKKILYNTLLSPPSSNK